MDDWREDHRGKGPKDYKRSQERIKEDVNDKLSDNWMIDASDIEVEVTDSEVTLTGSVKNRQSKRLAEDIAEDVSGVTHVQNNLRVNSTASSDDQTSTGYTTKNRKEMVSHN
jgi:osmotically-inducible protein OsmY